MLRSFSVQQTKCFKNLIKNQTYATLMESKTEDHAKRRVLAIYRILLKDLPWIKTSYQVTSSIRKMRDRLRKEFLLHKGVSDLKIIDNLIFNAVEQVEDTKVRHNQRAHVLRWFETDDVYGDDYVNRFLDTSMQLPDDLDFGPKSVSS
jgi:NADH dehydrogenase (ubiquinone) 1 alpha subcomplex subunit 6